MALLTRDALLNASDLNEKTVELPTLGGSVRIRSLPAKYSNDAITKSTKVSQDAQNGQTITVDSAMLETLQVFHGLVEPRFESIAAVETFARNCGSAWRTIVREIRELSELTEEAAATVEAAFPDLGGGAAGPEAATAANGSGGPDLHVRTGA